MVVFSRQVTGFLAAGTAGFAIDLLILHLLVDAGAWHIPARLVSISVAMVTTYLLNRKFSFKSKAQGREIVGEFARYVVASAFALVLNLALYSALVTFTGIGPILSAAIATVAAMFVNFASYSRLVFRRTEGTAPAAGAAGTGKAERRSG